MADRRASLRGDLALLCCAALWGATFPATRALLQHASPLTANALRFTAAALLLAPAGLRGRSSPARLPGIALGLVLGAGYALQTAGLARIGSARSAFLTALYVLMTPLVEWALRRGRPPLRTLAGGALAVAGVAVMSGPAAWRHGAAGGDLMTLGAALLFAVQIAGLTAALGVVPARRLLFQQIAACAAFSIVAAACLERPRFVPGPVSLGALAYLAAVATAFVFALQAYGQRRTSASRAAVLFATEPVWAAVFAALLGEPVRPRELAGGALVLAGVLAGTRRRSGRAQSSPGSHSPR